MAAWYVLALILALAWGTDARAQAPLSTPPKGPAGQPSTFATPPPPARKGECALLPGGRAPVGPIADLPTPLSPRSLDLIYFGKRLADLTPADFQRMAELSKRCPPGDNIIPAAKIEKLKEVIREAQTAREATIAWGKQRMVEVAAIVVMPIAALPSAPASAAIGLGGSPILSIGRPRLPGGEDE